MNIQPDVCTPLTDTNAKRDAIHCAIIPISAPQTLYPGEHIDQNGIPGGDNNIGIVNPFLKEPVEEGELCYLFVYPNTVTSLRHEWTHPAFDDVTIQEHDPEDVRLAKEQIDYLAENLNWSYDQLMAAAKKWIDIKYYTYENTETYKNEYWGRQEEFWRNYEIVTGTKVSDHSASFFTCSC